MSLMPEKWYWTDKGDSARLDKRFIVAALVTAVAIFILVLRLWYLQIYKGGMYADLSKNNRIRLRYIAPLRGRIYDRNGTLLVSNRPSFNVYVDLDEDPDRVANRLAPLLGMNAEEIMAVLDTGPKDRFHNSVRVRSDITWAQLSRIEASRFDLPGVSIQVEPKRDYLFPGLASHLIGFLGEINKLELADDKFHGVAAGEYIGKSGVEKTFGAFLRGRKGGRHVEVDASGREVRTLHRIDPIAGDDVYLTLDLALQEILQAELEDKVGAIVAMKPQTGEILAMASSPTFNQNHFIKGLSKQLWKKIVENPYKPLQNKAIQGQYPPGSLFKVVMALAALQEGVITENTVLKCRGRYQLGNRTYHCWKKWGHGPLKLKRALVESCDIFFYQVGQMLGVDRIAEYARMFGLAEASNIALDHETAGFIPTSQWKLRRFNVPWQKGETLSLAIGQSFTLVTPLQVAVLMSAVANEGNVMQPQLIKRVETPQGIPVQTFQPEVVRKLPFSPEHIRLLREALKDAVHSERGTGKRARVKGLTMAGKTGTVQVVAIKDAMHRKKLEEMPYEHRDHAWFACFAPFTHSQIVLSILIEHGGHGGSAAAPIARRIFKAYFEYNETAGERMT